MVYMKAAASFLLVAAAIAPVLAVPVVDATDLQTREFETDLELREIDFTGSELETREPRGHGRRSKGWS